MKWRNIPHRSPRLDATARQARATLAILLMAGLLLWSGAARAQVIGKDWSRLTPTNAPWESNPSGAHAVLFNNALWFYGAYFPDGSYSELCKSINGVTWTRALDRFPWAGYNRARLVPFKGKLWAYYVNGAAAPEDIGIWNSSDGTHWTQVVRQSPWAGWVVSGSNVDDDVAVIEFGGKIWFMDLSKIDDRLWSSSDGVNFTKVTVAAPFPGRMESASAVAVFQNKLWVLGGLSFGSLMGDVWCTADGSHWTKVTDSAPWGPRSRHQAVVCAGKLWVFGGVINSRDHGEWPSDVWCTADGSQWSRVTDAPWSGRRLYTAASFQGQIQLFCTRIEPAPSYARSCEVWATPPPRIAVPAFSRGATATVQLTPVTGAVSYTVQCDDAPDFATPLKTVTLASGSYTFTGLQNGRTYWYRVRANLPAGPGAWSVAVASLQDAVAPSGTVTQDLADATVPALGAKLKLAWQDPGTTASGLDRMRARLGDEPWSAWTAYRPTLLMGPTAPGTFKAQVQVVDYAGNIRQGELTVVVKAAGTAYVNLGNAAGPWDGSAAHPWRKIQDAVNQAPNGGEIIVAQGVYRENVKIGNKYLVMHSTNPKSAAVVKATVIDGGAQDSVIEISDAANGGGAWIEGFTITNGKARQGGGIDGGNAAVTIQNNRILRNVAYQYYPWVSVRGNEFSGIFTDVWPRHFGYGGAIAACNGVIQNNLIAYNTVGTATPVQETSHDRYTVYSPALFYYEGAALYGCYGVVRHNTLWRNSAYAPGRSSISACLGEIRNNIIWDETATAITSSSTPSYCDIKNWKGGGTGNLAADPLFVNAPAGDYSLTASSPCIDAGGLVAGPASDIVGTARPIRRIDPPRGDGSGYDIGAYEYPVAMVAAPVITMAPGTAADTVKVTLTCPVAGATIRSTWSGVEPTPASPLYTAPLILRGAPGTSITVKARAFKTGWSYSPVASKTYTFPGRTM